MNSQKQKTISSIIIFIIIIFCITGCKDFYEKWFSKDIEVKITYSFGNNLNHPYVGNEILIDGSQSNHGPDDTVKYEWALTEIPDGSKTTLGYVAEQGNITLKKKKFTPDLSGIYIVKLTISNNISGEEKFLIQHFEVIDSPSHETDVLQIEASEPRKVQISWAAVGKATEYKLYRSISNSGPFNLRVYLGSALEFKDTSVAPGNEYYYAICAGNPAGDGPIRISDQVITPLESPQNFRVVSHSSTSVEVSWDQVENAEEYVIFQKKSVEIDWVEAFRGTSSTTVISDLDEFQVYNFKITAINNNTNINLPPILPIEVNLSLIPPEAPENVNITAGTQTSLTLSWNSVTNVISPILYFVYRADTEYGNYKLINAEGINETTFTDLNLDSGSDYFYKIKAFANEYYSPDSQPVCSSTTVPLAPVLLEPIDVKPDSITMQWKTTLGTTEYHLSYHKPAENPTVITIPALEHEFMQEAVEDLEPYTTYIFTIRASNSLGSSANLAPSVQVQTLPPVIDAPTNLIISNITKTGFHISWDQVQDAANYYVYINDKQHGEPTLTSKKTVDDLLTGNVIHVKVSSGNGLVSSPLCSQPVQVALLTESPHARLTVPSPIEVQLSWDSVTGASTYNIYKAVGETGEFPTTPYRTSLTGRSFTDTGVLPYSWYRYKVTSVNQDGKESKESYPESIQTPKPHNPGNIGVTSGFNKITLSWDRALGASSYIVRKLSTGKDHPVTSGESFTDTGVTYPNKYEYSIRSKSSNGIESEPPWPTIIAGPMQPYINSITYPASWSTFYRDEEVTVYWESEGISNFRISLLNSSGKEVDYWNTSGNNRRIYFDKAGRSGTYYIRVADASDPSRNKEIPIQVQWWWEILINVSKNGKVFVNNDITVSNGKRTIKVGENSIAYFNIISDDTYKIDKIKVNGSPVSNTTFLQLRGDQDYTLEVNFIEKSVVSLDISLNNDQGIISFSELGDGELGGDIELIPHVVYWINGTQYSLVTLNSNEFYRLDKPHHDYYIGAPFGLKTMLSNKSFRIQSEMWEADALFNDDLGIQYIELGYDPKTKQLYLKSKSSGVSPTIDSGSVEVKFNHVGQNKTEADLKFIFNYRLNYE